MLVVSGSRMSMGSKWPEYGAQMISFGRQGRGSVARWGSGVGVARTRILAPFSRAAACGPRRLANLLSVDLGRFNLPTRLQTGLHCKAR
jgi:hypothetical protein